MKSFSGQPIPPPPRVWAEERAHLKAKRRGALRLRLPLRGPGLPIPLTKQRTPDSPLLLIAVAVRPLHSVVPPDREVLLLRAEALPVISAAHDLPHLVRDPDLPHRVRAHDLPHPVRDRFRPRLLHAEGQLLEEEQCLRKRLRGERGSQKS